MNLITHNEMLIESPAALVWPHIVQPGAWKQGAELQQVAGPTGARGALYAAVMPGSKEPAYYVLDVEFVPNARRTLKLMLSREGPLLGFASWGLRERGGFTTITYDVYSVYEQRGPQAGDSSTAHDETLEAQKIVAAQTVRFDEELRRLKELVERHGGA